MTMRYEYGIDDAVLLLAAWVAKYPTAAFDVSTYYAPSPDAIRVSVRLVTAPRWASPGQRLTETVSFAVATLQASECDILGLEAYRLAVKVIAAAEKYLAERPVLEAVE